MRPLWGAEQTGPQDHGNLSCTNSAIQLERSTVNPLKLVTTALFACPLILASVSVTAAVDAPKESCAGIRWNPAFLQDYPKAAAACREVTVKDGVKFAKFNGKVSKVDDRWVDVEISDVMDIPISTVAFQVGVGGQVTMNDKVEKVKDLKVGDVLTFWVQEGEFGISPTLADKPVAIIKPKVMPAT